MHTIQCFTTYFTTKMLTQQRCHFYLDTRDYKTLVDREDMEVVRELYCKERTEYGCSDEIAEFFIMLMAENGISNEINTPEEARELYLVLLTLSENEL